MHPPTQNANQFYAYQHQQQAAPRPTVSNYLLGRGPMPPPTPQEIAVARMNRDLDSGMFSGTPGRLLFCITSVSC